MNIIKLVIADKR